MILLAPLGALGRWVLGALAAVGRVALFALSALSHMLRPPLYPREILQALLNVGWLSLPVVGLDLGLVMRAGDGGGGRRFWRAADPQVLKLFHYGRFVRMASSSC